MSIKWFFALNDAGNDYANYCLMTQVAVRSARRHTSLEPIFLFDGEPCALTRWMQDHGVRVVHHRTSMYERLVEHARSSGRKQSVSTGAGAYLRLDIPELCEQLGIEDRHVLYTDCDVMFRRDVAAQLQVLEPEFFAAAPQSDPSNYLDMNSGVLWMNVPRLREMLVPFRAYINEHMDTLRKTGYDQAALRAFYGSRRNGSFAWDRLPLELNWKPHWGRNDRAAIVHFHGPKPTSRTLLARGMAPLPHAALARDDYYRACQEWDTHAGGLQPLPVVADAPASRRTVVEVLAEVPVEIEGFDEAAYLQAFPDVARAVAQGRYASGREHYRVAGIWEGRPVAPAIHRQVLNLIPEARSAPGAPPAWERAASRCWGALAAALEPASGTASRCLPLIGPAALAERMQTYCGPTWQVRCARGVADIEADAKNAGDAQKPRVAIVSMSADQVDAGRTVALLTALRDVLAPGARVVFWIVLPGPPKGAEAGVLRLAREHWSRVCQVLSVQRKVGGDRHDLVVLSMPAAAVA